MEENSKNNEEEVVLLQMQETNEKKAIAINKRIDFEKSTLKRLETMIPMYTEDLEKNASTSEIYGSVIKLAINSLFENDFKKKLEEL